MTLTPALQQSIRLLQLSSLDLQSEIERALDENPMLEADNVSNDGADITPVVQNVDAQATPAQQSERYSGSRQSRDDDQQERPESSSLPTLREHLLAQLGTTRASDRDSALVGLLIDDLNDDGFLESSLQSIHDMLDPELAVEIDELSAALSLLQSFDPPGIGARDLAECLNLQLKHPDLACIPALDDPQIQTIAQQICTEYLEVLAAGN
ncbi:MAG TPA: RNA polymerase sigma-54 factor, partial [Orrella sp.]